jgi:hypothetical protein
VVESTEGSRRVADMVQGVDGRVQESTGGYEGRVDRRVSESTAKRKGVDDTVNRVDGRVVLVVIRVLINLEFVQ